MRVPQSTGTKGSLKWMQRLVAEVPDFFRGGSPPGLTPPSDPLEWVSPLSSDQWAEYRDGDFLDRIGHGSLKQALSAFWPTNGPQWDGLAVSALGEVVLVEAKANIPELHSACGASLPSRGRIDTALTETATALGTVVTPAWTDTYYQYANRLAHLHFLRKNGVQAQMLFIYFVGDGDVRGPMSKADWQTALTEMYKALGLAQKPGGVVDAFVSVEPLRVIQAN